MDFKSGQQLIGLCETNECPISEIMLIREETFTERTRKDIINQMGKTWQIMKESAHSSVENPKHSIDVLKLTAILQLGCGPNSRPSS